ncbi:protein phosphatase 1 regulatory subunit 12A-like isoform X6 [Mytilus edulis]|uniref:protein phosphatase 1 regulatory subunit 12A-like isoform X6 n=1 Tax=Mytilus edulis TaxID=6550 RepID=UPI0039F0DDFB
MADESLSALNRRFNQLKRWEESETNKASHLPKEKPRKVKFQDGCVFLAACSSGDRDEVLQLLKKGADINTSNIDGLTALHQACIDDNLDMVEFLVQHSADVDVCDNEGWTPLHATASCGFTEIARYLIKEGANVAAVNNDGDLPIDICEDEIMEHMLQDEMSKLDIDADAARQEEENQMLEDANKWLNNKSVKEKRHQKTGATALHVAAAKGYMKVISVLLQAGVDVNARDNDGWTPLHAAAHWCQEEVCKALVDHMCDMDIKNNAGQTPTDVADSEIIKLLEELKAKQQSLKDKENEDTNEIIPHRNQHGKRSRSDSQSSVTRMSVDQKQNVILKEVGQERSTLEANLSGIKSSSSSSGEGESSESDTEKQNELNKQSTEANQTRDRDKPPITAVVEIQKPEMGKIEESNENDTVQVKKKDEDVINEVDKKTDTPRIEEIGETKESLKEKENAEKEAKEKQETEQTERKPDEKSVRKDKDFNRSNSVPAKEKEPLSRTYSAPNKPTEVPTIVTPPTITESKNDTEPDILSWRTGLRKTGSTSMVIENNKDEGDKNLSRSLSSPRIPVDRNSVENDKVQLRRTTDTQDHKPLDRISAYSRSINNPYRSSYQSAYVPYYRRQQEQNERREKEREAKIMESTTTTQPSTSTATSVSATLSSVTTATTTVSTHGVSSIASCPTFGTNSMFRRSYQIPSRDEEAETQRKARAKRARETRRSTQGVTLEDIQKAEEVLHSSDTKPSDTKSSEKTNNALSESRTSNIESTSIEQPESVRRRFRPDVSSRTSNIESTSIEQPESVRRCFRPDVSSRNSNIELTSIDQPESVRRRFRPDVSNRTSNIESTSIDQPESVRRRFRPDVSSRTSNIKLTSIEQPESVRRRFRPDDDTRSSFRRSRDSKDSSIYSTDTTSAYVPRRERNALSTSIDNKSSLGSSEIRRSASLRSSRLHAEDQDDTDSKKDSKGDDKDEKKEPSHVRARRNRRERRSTGIVTYDPSKDDDEDEKKDTEEKDKNSYSGRYNSTSDVGTSDRYSHRTDRPSSYIGSTSSLNLDYKKLDYYMQLYEDEKANTERLKKDLEAVKKELIESKAELDRLIKRNEVNRLADTNDKREKRALERKLSELEEELKDIRQLFYLTAFQENGSIKGRQSSIKGRKWCINSCDK